MSQSLPNLKEGNKGKAAFTTQWNAQFGPEYYTSQPGNYVHWTGQEQAGPFSQSVQCAAGSYKDVNSGCVSVNTMARSFLGSESTTDKLAYYPSLTKSLYEPSPHNPLPDPTKAQQFLMSERGRPTQAQVHEYYHPLRM